MIVSTKALCSSIMMLWRFIPSYLVSNRLSLLPVMLGPPLRSERCVLSPLPAQVLDVGNDVRAKAEVCRLRDPVSSWPQAR